MTWFSRLKWVLAILLVFFLILMTNLIDKENFRVVNDTVEAIYEDRIVANDIIFELSLLIHQKEIAAALSDAEFFKNENNKVNEEIEQLLIAYDNRDMSPQERKIFKRLKDDLDEKNSIKNVTAENKDAYKRQIDRIHKNLYKLAKIQLREGKNKMLVSKKAFEGVKLFTKIEVYLLIFIAIILQIVIFYRPNKKSQ